MFGWTRKNNNSQAPRVERISEGERLKREEYLLAEDAKWLILKMVPVGVLLPRGYYVPGNELAHKDSTVDIAQLATDINDGLLEEIRDFLAQRSETIRTANEKVKVFRKE